jgi:DHA2 family multidrug resistance protein
MANLYLEDPPYLRQALRGAIDYLGFGCMALWLGTLQLVLDKGQEMDWFGTVWIRWTAAVSLLALVGFIYREFTTPDPIVQLRVFANRDFAVGTTVAVLYGFTLYGVTALLPLFLQTLLGYSALDSGLAVSPRGIGSIVSMVLVGLLVNKIDSRILLAFGCFLIGVSTWMLSRVNLDIGMSAVVWPNILNGFSGGFLFVPLTTLTMSRLKKEQIGNGAGIYNLMRNIGGSVGIASVTTMLVRGAQTHQNYLTANVTASTPAASIALSGLQAHFHIAGAASNAASQQALGSIYRAIQQQASLLAYADNFRTMTFLMLICLPLLVLFHRPSHHADAHKEIHAE